MRAVAIYRSALYSPGRHRSNDAAIMDAVAGHVVAAGWEVERLGESDIEAGIVPAADLYLNMCQGSSAATRLLELEREGACLVNRPSAVLGCHRHRLIPALESLALPMPRTLLLSTRHATPEILGQLPPATEFWVKRGDVHAQESADVVRTSRQELGPVLAAFADRGIARVAIQEHVAGPVIKFYGVGHDRLFYAFRDDGRAAEDAVVDLARLRRLAFAAARGLGLAVFGGDVVAASRTDLRLIDLNDWPSFAPVRSAAAEAIARLACGVAAPRSVV